MKMEGRAGKSGPDTAVIQGRVRDNARLFACEGRCRFIGGWWDVPGLRLRTDGRDGAGCGRLCRRLARDLTCLTGHRRAAAGDTVGQRRALQTCALSLETGLVRSPMRPIDISDGPVQHAARRGRQTVADCQPSAGQGAGFLSRALPDAAHRPGGVAAGAPAHATTRLRFSCRWIGGVLCLALKGITYTYSNQLFHSLKGDVSERRSLNDTDGGDVEHDNGPCHDTRHRSVSYACLICSRRPVPQGPSRREHHDCEAKPDSSA